MGCEVIMAELISVIVPIYKIEEVLNFCVQSIVNQTYKNLEIILVDDGSPDTCPGICDEWAEKDNRIKVIHKKNGGLSDARNAGLKIASGDFISFIDGDDCIHADFFDILMKVMISEQCDIVQCEYVKTQNYNVNTFEKLNTYSIETFNNQKAFEMLIGEKKFKQVVWNKLYKREVITLDFEFGITNEDEFWTYKIFDKAKKIAYIDVTLYYYMQREGSIMGQTYSLKRLDGIRARVERHRYIQNNHPNLVRYSKVRVYFECIYAYQMSDKFLNKDDTKIAKEYLLKTKNEFKPGFKDFKGETFKQKIWLLLSKISFVGTCRFRSLIGYGF